MGESIMEATILSWSKNEGDVIAAEEDVLVVETDKVQTEVPSPIAGILVKKLFPDGTVVGIGKAIALIETNAAAEINQTAKTTVVQQSQTQNIPAHTVGSNEGRFYSPLVLNIAREEGISSSELDSIAGTGKDGRVTKKDIITYIEQRQQAPANNTEKILTQATELPKHQAPTVSPTTSGLYIAPPKVEYGDNVEIVEMDRMRQRIAEHMVMSKHVSPHVTSFVETDVTNLVRWRERVKTAFEKREGEKITITPVFIEALAIALKEFPLVNASIDGNNIVIRKNIHIGMAAALPTGNLIVPVIRNADHKNLIGLSKEVNDLAQRARNGKLKPEDVQGGTFTLSNVGTFGSVMGTPIINQPQVAIIATGTIRKKPAVLETPYGDVIAIRHQMFMSLSYDHRLIDGALGSRFLKRVSDLLEGFDDKRTI